MTNEKNEVDRRAAPSSSADELPPLPSPEYFGIEMAGVDIHGYTAEQMQDYARSAIAADRRARQGEPVGEVLDGYTGDSRAVRIYRGQEFKTGDKLYRAATKAAAPADCVACEGMPCGDNNPCGACGRAAPVPDTGIPTAGEDERAQFEAWAADHLGQGYPLTMDEGAYEHPVTRWAFKAWVASRRAPVSSTPTSGAVEKATPYTCIGKGGRYLLLGTATGAGTSRDLEDLRIYIDAENPLEMYYRTVPNFDLRMARMDDATPSHPSEAQAGEDA